MARHLGRPPLRIAPLSVPRSEPRDQCISSSLQPTLSTKSRSSLICARLRSRTLPLSIGLEHSATSLRNARRLCVLATSHSILTRQRDDVMSESPYEELTTPLSF